MVAPLEAVRRQLLKLNLGFLVANWGAPALEAEVHLEELHTVVEAAEKLMDSTGILYRITMEPSRLEWEEYDHWLVRLERIDEAEAAEDV